MKCVTPFVRFFCWNRPKSDDLPPPDGGSDQLQFFRYLFGIALIVAKLHGMRETQLAKHLLEQDRLRKAGLLERDGEGGWHQSPGHSFVIHCARRHLLCEFHNGSMRAWRSLAGQARRAVCPKNKGCLLNGRH